MVNQKLCKNCNSDLTGFFCQNCGQRTSVGRVTFSETIQDIINNMFSLDAPLWATLKTLIINPGKLFRDFLSGKRKTYYKPVSFFILTTIIFVLVKALLNYDPMQDIAKGENDSVDMNLLNNAGVFMAKNINNIIFSYVFAFALMLKLFFHRRYLLAEYLAISFYIVGFYIIVTILSMFGLQFAHEQYKMLPFIIMFIYVVYALLSFFQNKGVVIISKILLVYFFSIILYMILGYGISFLIVWLKSL